jgi:hypothetical protein
MGTVGYRRRRAFLGTAMGLAMLVSAPVAHGASAPCRVRNVTQDTSGRSLIRMVERAHDGDRLRVRGTCPGRVIIDVDIDIRGVGERPTVTGRSKGTVMEVKRGSSVTLRGLTIQRGDAGFADNFVGGILNEGWLTLIDAIVRRNGGEGAIANLNYLRIDDSLLRHNGGVGSGGAIYNGGRLIIRRSRLIANGTEGNGGAIANGRGASARIIDSTLARNGSGLFGGGISNEGSITLVRSSLSENEAFITGGGLWSEGTARAPATVRLIDTVISRNIAIHDSGGGIVNGSSSTVTLEGTSAIIGNSPGDCVGTEAC